MVMVGIMLAVAFIITIVMVLRSPLPLIDTTPEPEMVNYRCRVHFQDGAFCERVSGSRHGFIYAADYLYNTTGFDVEGVFYPGTAIVKIEQLD